MAFKKSITLPSGITGDYWRIIQRNSNFSRNDDVVTLQLYKDEQARAADLQPLNHSVRFNFYPDDHPLTDFDPDRVDTSTVDDFRDLELHVRYLHIIDVAEAARDIPEENRTENERAAIWFIDAESLV